MKIVEDVYSFKEILMDSMRVTQEVGHGDNVGSGQRNFSKKYKKNFFLYFKIIEWVFFHGVLLE